MARKLTCDEAAELLMEADWAAEPSRKPDGCRARHCPEGLEDGMGQEFTNAQLEGLVTGECYFLQGN
jgi:hypothetical protein